tara:strand:- start:1989 stop:2630 length:642 start_codon:yes stop_codon:yes gene_type:complete
MGPNLKHKIQSIKPQKKRRDRFTVILESGDVFGISGDVLLSNPLYHGQNLTTKELDHVKQIENQQKIKIKILNYLSYRERSKEELRNALKNKGYTESEIEPVLTELESKGYLNDKSFTIMYATYLINKKLLGRKSVISKFYQHKIPDDILSPILDDLYRTYPIEKGIKLIIEKRISVRGNSLKEKKNLVNLLFRKGYSWADIEHQINENDWVK